jgi:hypothetical protein
MPVTDTPSPLVLALGGFVSLGGLWSASGVLLAAALRDAILSICHWQKVSYAWQPNLPDDADNHLVELAVAGGGHRSCDLQSQEPAYLAAFWCPYLSTARSRCPRPATGGLPVTYTAQIIAGLCHENSVLSIAAPAADRLPRAGASFGRRIETPCRRSDVRAIP